jgi:hypothetical protein
LIGGEPLEVASDDRLSERLRQSIDLAVERFGPLALDYHLLGSLESRRCGLATGSMFLGLSAPTMSQARLARGPHGDTVEPGVERVWVANRPGALCKYEEHRLKRVLGVVAIAQKLAADSHYHWPMARHDRGESGLAIVVFGGREPIEQLAVRETRDRAVAEERPEVPGQSW